MQKVTVGFKCAPELKRKLIENATKAGLTLSEYMECSCNEGDLVDSYDLEMRDKAIMELQTKLVEQELELKEYHEILDPYLDQFKGQEFKFTGADSRECSFLVENHIHALCAILISLTCRGEF